MMSTDRPLISVIMLTYNRQAYVGRAIESILKQTLDDFEFIIVDNGSSDASAKVCAGYAAKDGRIRFIQKEQGNIGSGRNVGLDVAKGRYIAFVDDDDWAEPDMLAFLYGLVEAAGAEIAFCGSTREMDGVVESNCTFSEKVLLTPNQAIYELFERKKMTAGTPTKLFAVQLFREIHFPEIGRYDDIAVIYKLFASARLVVGHGLPKYCCYRHSGNNSAFTDKDGLLFPSQLEEYFSVYRERTAWLCERLPDIAEYVRYSEWSFYISMLHKIKTAGLEARCFKQLDYLEKTLCKNYEEFFTSRHTKGFEKEWLTKYFDKNKV